MKKGFALAGALGAVVAAAAVGALAGGARHAGDRVEPSRGTGDR